MWSKGNSTTLLMGMLIGIATVENTIEFSHTLIIELPPFLWNPFLFIYLKKTKTLKRYMHSSVLSVTMLSEIWQRISNAVSYHKQKIITIYIYSNKLYYSLLLINTNKYWQKLEVTSEENVEGQERGRGSRGTNWSV